MTRQSFGGRKRQKKGFTLIELLVVVTIMGILVGLSFAGVSKALNMAARSKEMAAGRTLITAYNSAAIDENGYYPAGFDQGAKSVVDGEGKPITGQAAHRYPYRLAPYFAYDIKGTILVSANSGIKLTDTYSVSVFPSFGINSKLVGGERNSEGKLDYASDCMQTPGRGSAVLVFATAASGQGTQKQEGFHRLFPPKTTEDTWSGAAWTETSDPAKYGNLDPRYGKKVISVFSDGSVKMLSIDELRDMTLWSYRAASVGNPNYVATQ